jgi:hypothetical protein
MVSFDVWISSHLFKEFIRKIEGAGTHIEPVQFHVLRGPVLNLYDSGIEVVPALNTTICRSAGVTDRANIYWYLTSRPV